MSASVPMATQNINIKYWPVSKEPLIVRIRLLKEQMIESVVTQITMGRPQACLGSGGVESVAVAVSSVGKHLAGGHIESADQRLRSVADVLELLMFDVARVHRQGRGSAFKCLDARHLIDQDRLDAGLAPFEGKSMGLID